MIKASSKTNTRARKAPAVRKPTSGTKQDNVLAMLLRSKSGTNVTAIMRATGWQGHTVRAFFSAVVRKRLGLNLSLAKKEGGDTVYRIVSDKRPSGRKART